MSRNLILCADGTGNKGGSTPDSNVFKMFNAVDTHTNKTVQRTFYDNGVGTSNIKLFQAIGGGLGVGFKNNVCDLYKYLARNYQDDDRIYLFGFSRGAATIRALTGFIGCCGLINGRHLDQDTLDQETDDLFKIYEKAKDGKTPLTDNWPKGNQGAVPIEFVGVWDTVSALGFPKGTDILGPFSFLLDTILRGLDWLSNQIKPHHFYQYQLFDNIKHAYHAVAIDDERTAFQPIIWDETERPEGSVEQVWFTGMHSNVGGGYARDGLAYISLYWMMIKAQNHGLIFKQDHLQEAYDSRNPSGHMYNSRSGLAVFYRYHPREIEELCANKISDIKIHQSVLKRMSRKTANYAPGNLPPEFSVTQLSPPPGKKESQKRLCPGSDENWVPIRKKVDSAIYWRKQSYMTLLVSTLLLVSSALYFWNNSVECNFQVKYASEDNNQQSIIDDFISAFKISENKCTVLMVNSADAPTKWATLNNSNDMILNNHEKIFDDILIKHSGNKLSFELNITPNIENKDISQELKDIEPQVFEDIAEWILKDITPWALKHIAEGLTYALPRIFDNLIQEAVIKKPEYFLGVMIFSLLLWRVAFSQRRRKHRESAKLRKIIIDQYRR